MAKRATKTVETDRNSRGWRVAGYRTLFRNGCVVLVQAARGSRLAGAEGVWVRGVESGQWMSEINLDRGGWTRSSVARLDATPAGEAAWSLRLDDVARTVFHCYCDAGCALCDFCSGMREAPELPALPAAPEIPEWPDLTKTAEALDALALLEARFELEPTVELATEMDAAERRAAEAFANDTADRNDRETALRVSAKRLRKLVDGWKAVRS